MTRSTSRLLDSWTSGESRNVHEDMMAVTLEIVSQCLFGAEVTGVAERVGKAMQVVTDRFIADASLALLLPFDLPAFLAPARRRAISDLNEIITVKYAPDGDIWASFAKDMCPGITSSTANCTWDTAAHAKSMYQGAVGRLVHR